VVEKKEAPPLRAIGLAWVNVGNKGLVKDFKEDRRRFILFWNSDPI
jgi:hypothetical protein